MRVHLLQFAFTPSAAEAEEKDFVTVAVLSTDIDDTHNAPYILNEAREIWGQEGCFRCFPVDIDKIVPC